MHLIVEWEAKRREAWQQTMGPGDRLRIMSWVGSEVLPHEGDLRARLRRLLPLEDVEDVVQEAYYRISRLEDVRHIQSGRAYLFTTARMLVLERIRRLRVVQIEAMAEIEVLPVLAEEHSPERIASGRRELARVRALIEALPDRCRRIFELRKIEGLSQRQVAAEIGVPEHIVENDVAKGLKLILRAIETEDQAAEQALTRLESNERPRDSKRDL